MLIVCLLQAKHGLVQQVKGLAGLEVLDEESKRSKTNIRCRSTHKWKNEKLWLSLMRFNMNFVEPVNIPIAFQYNIS
jgi:hypothetical protein